MASATPPPPAWVVKFLGPTNWGPFFSFFFFPLRYRNVSRRRWRGGKSATPRRGHKNILNALQKSIKEARRKQFVTLNQKLIRKKKGALPRSSSTNERRKTRTDGEMRKQIALFSFSLLPFGWHDATPSLRASSSNKKRIIINLKSLSSECEAKLIIRSYQGRGAPCTTWSLQREEITNFAFWLLCAFPQPSTLCVCTHPAQWWYSLASRKGFLKLQSVLD